MSSYLLAIYKKDLSKDNYSQVASILCGATIENINERMSLFIGCGFKKRYQIDQSYFCYRFLSQELAPMFFLIEPRPLYIGRFNEEEERKCAMMSAHCHSILELIEMTIGKSLEFEPYYKEIFDQDSQINSDAVHGCIKELKKHLRASKNIQAKYFSDRKIAAS